MATNIYFWVGLVLCLCAIIILTYIATLIKHSRDNRVNNINDNIVNSSTMLTGSDTISTLITGILLLSLSTSNYDNIITKEMAMECTSQLIMKVSTYLLPILNGLLSIPAWMYHLYKCTNCNNYQDIDDESEKSPPNSTSDNRRKTAITIILQWLIPLLSILSIITTEPETMKINKEQTTFNISEIQLMMMMMIKMDETLCDVELNFTNISINRNSREDQNLLLNNKNITSTIVNRIYDIVKQQTTNYNIDDNQDKQSKYEPEKLIEQNSYIHLMNTLLNNQNTTQYTFNDNNSTKIINNVTTILNNKKNIDKLRTKIKTIDNENYDILNGQYTVTNTNILKLMENYTTQKNEDEATKLKIYNDTDNNQCYTICQPPKWFLKNLLFSILFINFFLPLIVTAILTSMAYKNIQIIEFTKQHKFEKQKTFSKILGWKTIIGALTLSPTLIETITRILLSINIPEYLSSGLLIIAMVGIVIRNIAGLYLVNIIHNSKSSIHPEVQVQPPPDTINIEKPHPNKICVEEIENQPGNQVTSTSSIK